MSCLNTLSACFAVSALLLSVVSCKKTDPPAPSTPTGTLSIALSYPDSYTEPGSTVELIITEPGGKVLLDTTAPPNTTVAATLHTNATLVDVTTLAVNTDTSLTVTTFKSVNPSSWQTSLPNNYSSPNEQPLRPVALNLINIPPAYSTGYEPIMISNNRQQFDFELPINGTTLTTGIEGSVNNMLYTLLPARLLYSFMPVASANDTVVNGPSTVIDFSQPMDTARVLTFSKPAGYSAPFNVTLYGIMDTTDFSKTLNLYQPTVFIIGDGLQLPDVVYPPKNVQKYELSASLVGPTGKIGVSYYSYGDSLTGSFPFPTTASYTLTSNQPDNFSVQFLSVSPTYYQTEWTAGKIYFYEYSAPDTTVQHPLTFLTGLNAQKLKGQDLSGLQATSFSFDTFEGMDYAGFWGYACNPAAILTKRVSSSIYFYQVY